MSRHVQSPPSVLCLAKLADHHVPGGGGEGTVNREQEKSPLCTVTLGHVCEIARVLLGENAIQYDAYVHIHTRTGRSQRARFIGTAGRPTDFS